MRVPTYLKGIVGLLWVLWMASPASAGEALYCAEVSAGVMVRDQAPDRSAFQAPGGGLRVEAGRALHDHTWLLASLHWARLGETAGGECFDCLRTEGLDSLVAGLGLRQALPFEGGELFVQAGLGFLFDLVQHSGGLDGEPPPGFNRQFVFQSGVGLGFELGSRWRLGVRLDSLVGDGVQAAGLTGFVAVRFDSLR